MGISSTSGLGSEISMDKFLTLFVTQLRNQNPLDPTDNSQFMSQLAQFSTLEQAQRQTAYLSNMNSMQVASLQLDQLSMAGTFIGKTIKYSSNAGGLGGNNTLSGVVQGVKLEKDGTISFVVNGQSVSIANLIEVDNMPTSNTSSSSNIQYQSVVKR